MLKITITCHLTDEMVDALKEKGVRRLRFIGWDKQSGLPIHTGIAR